MPNTNIMLGFPNRIDQATLSGGSWSTTLPLSNVQTREIAQVARTVDADEDSTRFLIDFENPTQIAILAFINHNASFSAKVEIKTSNTADFSTIINSYVGDVWSGISDTQWVIEELEWENDNYWLGSYSSEEIIGFTSVSTQIINSFKPARYFQIDIKDSLNVAGYFEVGRIFIGPAVQPRINYSYGANLQYDTNTAVETALNGAEFFDYRESARIFRFSLEMMDDSEAYGKFLEIIRRAGIHQEIFVIPDPADSFQGLRRNFMGRNRQLNPLEQTMWADDRVKNSVAFEIKELR